MKRLLSLTVAAVVLSGCQNVADPGAAVPIGPRAARTMVTDVTMTDLGTLPGYSTSSAASINNHGQVAGLVAVGNTFTRHAAIWDNGAITDLGVISGASAFSFAGVINDLGQVVGASTTASDPFQHYFFWQNGSMTDLGRLGSTIAAGTLLPHLNNAGQMTGAVTVSVTPRIGRGFVWQNGVTTDLGTLGTRSTPNAINDNGQIAGSSVLLDGNQHAFLWENGTMTDLGTLGGLTSDGNAINASGDVVGNGATPNGDLHAALWRHGVVTDLGTLPGDQVSIAVAINDIGQVVGFSRATPTSSVLRAFIWTNGTLTDLGTLGGALSTPVAINNLGQVIGRSKTADGVFHAFLWQNGRMFDLGANAFASDINDAGQVVGQIPVGSIDTHAVVWNTLRPATVSEEFTILTDAVNGLMTDGTLNRGQGQSLIAKLNNAKLQTGRGDPAAAAHHMQLFLDEVNRDTAAGILSNGASLTGPAQHIIDMLTR